MSASYSRGVRTKSADEGRFGVGNMYHVPELPKKGGTRSGPANLWDFRNPDLQVREIGGTSICGYLRGRGTCLLRGDGFCDAGDGDVEVDVSGDGLGGLGIDGVFDEAGAVLYTLDAKDAGGD